MRPARPQRRSRPFLLVLLLGAAGALFYYMQCGDGFGLGPGGGGGVGSEARDGDRVDSDRTDEAAKEPDDSTRKAVGSVRRCQLRLDAKGLTMGGEETSVDDAVSACKKAGGAELTATGDAVIGELQRVREALDKAGVEVFERSRSGSGNP